MLRLALGLSVVAFAGAALLPVSGASAAPSCAASTIGVDTSLANNSGGTLLDSVGQTFLATDTLITSLTLWAVAGGQTYSSVTAMIVATDANGVPTTQRLWVSPPLTVPGNQAKAFTWTIDPPLALPRAGLYAWFICSTIMDLMVVTGSDPYPGGEMWWAACRGACGPGCNTHVVEGGDFVFNVTFCADHSTPARPPTWGRLKSIYR
jgi:hypothetical protein